jgi:hypothetical protein
MRTTVKIDDRLLVEAKTRAAMTGRTLNQVVEDALREAFARRGAEASRPALPVFGDGRLAPGVDLDDSAALLDLMDGRA